jgi:hypothetical protein
MESLTALGLLILRQNPKLLIGLGVLIFILKTGIRGILPWSNFEPVIEFPSVVSGFSSYSLGLAGIAHLFHATSEVSYFMLNVTLLLALMFIFYRSLLKLGLDKKTSTLIFLLLIYSPVGIVLAGNIGRHDLLTIAGYALFFTSKSAKLKYLWLILGVLGSPEHFIVGWIFAYLTAFALGDSDLKKLCQRALFVSILFFLPIFVYVYTSTQSTDRITNIVSETGLMKVALQNSLFSFPLEFYSYFGILIPLFFFVFHSIYCRDKHKFRLIFLIYFIPVLLNTVIVDKTRDYVIAMLASSVVLIKSEYRKGVFSTYLDKSSGRLNLLVGMSAVILLVFPSIEITFEGLPRSPHFWTYTKLVEFCSTSSLFC